MSHSEYSESPLPTHPQGSLLHPIGNAKGTPGGCTLFTVSCKCLFSKLILKSVGVDLLEPP